jgi:hypothetical protein
MRKINIAIFFVLAVAVLLSPALANACPGCTAAMNGSVSRGFNSSILFMMAMPFLVVGSIAAGLIYTYRRGALTSSDDNQLSDQPVQKEEKEN